MARIPALLAFAVTLRAAAGCPGRDAFVENVGGAPKRQLEDARTRVHSAEDKIEQNTKAADAVATE